MELMPYDFSGKKVRIITSKHGVPKWVASDGLPLLFYSCALVKKARESLYFLPSLKWDSTTCN